MRKVALPHPGTTVIFFKPCFTVNTVLLAPLCTVSRRVGDSFARPGTTIVLGS